MHRKMPGVVELICALVLIGAVAPTLALGADEADSTELQRILERFDQAQSVLATLSASFTETTTNAMLKEPIVAKGHFYMTKPDSIRWEYSAPEEMSFVIANDEYTGYFPLQKRAERRNIKRWSEHLFRFIGLGQGSAELSRFYTIHLPDGTVEEGTIELVLQPKKRRARKRVQSVHFWLDASTYLPRQVVYSSKDGGSRRIEFSDLQVNPDIAASLYRVEIPPEFEVTAGFNGLPDLQPEPAR